MKTGMGIAAKVSILTIFLILVTALGTTFYQIKREMSIGRETLVRHGRSLADMVAKNCEYGLYVEDRASLQQLIESAFVEESVAYMVILDRKGTPLASKTRSPDLAVPTLAIPVRSAGTRAGLTESDVEAGGIDYIEIVAPVLSHSQKDSLDLSIDQAAATTGLERLGSVRMGLSQQFMRNRIHDGLLSAFLFTTFFVFAGSCLTLIGARGLTAPIKGMTRIAEEIAEGEGDLTRTFEIRSGDEVGKLAYGFNRFVKRLREMVQQTRTVTADIVSATEKIRLSSQGVSGGVARQKQVLESSFTALKEIDADAADVANSTASLVLSAEEGSSATLELGVTIEEITEQVERLFSLVDGVSKSIMQLSASGLQIIDNTEALSSTTKLTVSSVGELDIAIRKIKENAEKTNGLSAEASKDAEHGMIVVEASIEGINKVSEMVDKAGNAILELGRKSGEIEKILTVIDEVTDQTALLSLNAAIIAAQAGEHGNGFAVVAKEIRELADRSASSTKEIAAIIGSLQHGTAAAVQAMKAGRDRVHEEVARSQETRTALQKIRMSTMKAAEQVHAIVSATQEQSQGSQQITSSINEVMSMLIQISTAVNQQGKGNENLSRAAEEMTEIASLVKHSTAEQAKGTRQINAHMENSRTMIEQINGATHSQTVRSRQVLELFSELRGIAEKNAEGTKQLDDVVDILTRQTVALEKEIGTFKI